MKKDPKSFRQKIDRSKKIKKVYLDDKELFLNLYTNQTKNERPNRKDLMQVNYIYSHIRLVSPTIFAGNPRVTVKSRFGDAGLVSQNARNLEGTIKYWSHELGAPAEFQSCLFDSFFGLAANEVGWDYRTQIIEEAVPMINPMTGEMLLGKNGLPILQMQEVEKVKSDQPFLRWRDSKDITLDVDVPRRKDGRFMVVHDTVGYDFVMKMEEIPKKLREQIKPTVRPEDMARNEVVMTRDGKPRDVMSDQEWVELEWIWCRESMTRYLMTPGIQDEFLLETPWPYDLEYQDDVYPVTILDSITDHRYPYSYSEFRPAMEHIRELNRIRTNTAYHIKANQPKLMYAKTALTRAQASKLANARPDELCEVNHPDGIAQAPMAVFPTETLGWSQQIANDLVKLTGLIEYEGDSQASTATEASIMEGRAQVRKRDRSRKFEEFVTASLAKLGQLCQQNMNAEVCVEINGPEGQTWQNLTKEQIQGEFLYEIEPGIMEFKNEALRKQQLLKYAEVMMNNPHANQRYIAEQLTKAFDLNTKDALVDPSTIQPTPPEPTIKFKPIDLKEIPSAQAQAQIVMAAMEQAGVGVEKGPPPGSPPAPPQIGGGINPADMVPANNMSPNAMPVEGNQVQPMSEMY